MNESVNIITDLDGTKIVLINDIRFKSRKGIDWNVTVQTSAFEFYMLRFKGIV